MNKKALGRGLNTLLPARPQPRPEASQVEPSEPIQPASPPPDAQVTELSVDVLTPNPFQPRVTFDEQPLNELAQSIRTDGVIQPLTVRKAANASDAVRYEIIAGERRWRASKIAGLSTVPVHVVEMADDRMLEVALVENIQREDLNPIETAKAFQRLSHDLGMSHEEIGGRTGKDRATISNSIRLLGLPPDVQELVEARKLSPGHARTLLKVVGLNYMRELAKKTIENDWSVRTLEAMTAGKTPTVKTESEQSKPQDPNVRAAIDDLERVLGTRVRIVDRGAGKGRIEIDYYSQDELDRIYGTLTSH